MKKFVSILFVLVAAPAAFAVEGQSVLSLPESKSDLVGYSTRGTRVMAVKPFLRYEAVGDFDTKKVTNSKDMNQGAGISIGYISAPVRRLGWEANLSGRSLEAGSRFEAAVALAGNAVLAFNNSFYVKSGMNVSHLTESIKINDREAEVRPGLGFQTGGGYQFTKNVGLDVSYLWLSQKHSLGGEVFQEGLELSLTGTF